VSIKGQLVPMVSNLVINEKRIKVNGLVGNVLSFFSALSRLIFVKLAGLVLHITKCHLSELYGEES